MLRIPLNIFLQVSKMQENLLHLTLSFNCISNSIGQNSEISTDIICIQTYTASDISSTFLKVLKNSASLEQCGRCPTLAPGCPKLGRWQNRSHGCSCPTSWYSGGHMVAAPVLLREQQAAGHKPLGSLENLWGSLHG